MDWRRLVAMAEHELDANKHVTNTLKLLYAALDNLSQQLDVCTDSDADEQVLMSMESRVKWRIACILRSQSNKSNDVLDESLRLLHECLSYHATTSSETLEWSQVGMQHLQVMFQRHPTIARRICSSLSAGKYPQTDEFKVGAKWLLWSDDYEKLLNSKFSPTALKKVQIIPADWPLSLQKLAEIMLAQLSVKHNLTTGETQLVNASIDLTQPLEDVDQFLYFYNLLVTITQKLQNDQTFALRQHLASLHAFMESPSATLFNVPDSALHSPIKIEVIQKLLLMDWLTPAQCTGLVYLISAIVSAACDTSLTPSRTFILDALKYIDAHWSQDSSDISWSTNLKLLVMERLLVVLIGRGQLHDSKHVLDTIVIQYPQHLEKWKHSYYSAMIEQMKGDIHASMTHFDMAIHEFKGKSQTVLLMQRLFAAFADSYDTQSKMQFITEFTRHSSLGKESSAFEKCCFNFSNAVIAIDTQQFHATKQHLLSALNLLSTNDSSTSFDCPQLKLFILAALAYVYQHSAHAEKEEHGSEQAKAIIKTAKSMAKKMKQMSIGEFLSSLCP